MFPDNFECFDGTLIALRSLALALNLAGPTDFPVAGQLTHFRKINPSQSGKVRRKRLGKFSIINYSKDPGPLLPLRWRRA